MASQSEPSVPSSAPASAAPPVRIRPLANRNFRLLWIGEGISHLGDQFYLIALPWLVFDLTGSSLAFGAILLVAGVPRALLMLVGGVVTDRVSPRRVMISSNLLRLGITAALTVLIAAQAVHLWLLFVIAFCFGLVDAFFYPAYRAMIPLLVEDDHLQASNALMQGTSQIINSVGPGVAGVLVEALGMVLSFGFDALTFLFSSVMLLLMRPAAVGAQAAPASAAQRRPMLAEIGDILAYIRRDALLTALIGVVGAINLLFTGPLVVGSATLAQGRFLEGSAAYGAMLSAFSVGMLAGTVIAGVIYLKRPGMISLLLVATQGLFMVGIAFSQSLVLTCGLWLLIGCTAGFGSINFVTLTQKRVSKPMIGRFMSLIALAEVGLAPLSNAIAGVVADVNVTALFIGAGLLLTTTCLLAISNRTVREGDMEPA
ncbi:MAG: MFS transporter [Anaerolineae bacterium]|nr:MFS transporter [Anaerolineae bacterium]